MSKKIALCIGHNPVKRGAYGSLGLSEYEYNKNFLAELLPYLPPNHDYKIFERKNLGSYTREQNDMHKQISKWGDCDIAIEFHFNGASDPDINGHEILYLSKSGKVLAEKLDECYDKHLHNNDRNIIKRDKGNGYGFLKRGNYTSLIVEPFFASNQERFIEGGEMYQPLVASYKEFFSKL